MRQLALVLADHDLLALERAAASEGTTTQDITRRAIHDFIVAHVAELGAEVRAAQAEYREQRRALHG